MAEEIKIVASAVGFDQVNKALDSTTKSLEETSQAATQAGKTLGNQLKAGSGQAQQSLLNLNRVVQDAPFGFIGIQNNINPLVESFSKLRAESGSTGGALKALIGGLSGAGGLGLAFAAVTSAITFAQIGFQAWTRSSQKAKETIDETAKALSSIQSSVASEASSVSGLVAILQNETETRQRKLSAIRELQKINPEIFNQLRLEGDQVVGLTTSYQAYIESLKNVVTAKVLQSKLEKEITKLLEQQGTTLTGNEKTLRDTANTIQTDLLRSQIKYLQTLRDQPGVYQKIQQAQAELRKIETGYSDQQNREINATKKNIQDLTDQLSQISQAIKVNDFTQKVRKVKEELDKLKYKPVKVEKIEIRTKELQKQIQDSLTELRPIEIPVLPEPPPIPLNFEISQDKLDQLNQVFTDAANNIAVGFGETLGNALSGNASIGDFFTGLFQQVGAAMISFGKLMIKFAIEVEVIKKFLLKNPYLAIAGGIALIALGTLLRNATNRPAFAVGTRYAPGGMALVGERGPEMINLPRGSQVIPAAQTSQMMGGIGGAIEVFGMLRGQDIFFSNKKYGQTYKRTT